MTVLLTNDDGYQSAGLAALRDRLLAAGLPVLVVAPNGPRSGTARSATFRRPVNIDRVGGDDENPIYACDGTPVDAVRVALLSHLASHVEVVVSGINEGANLGDDTTYSSTVGAAWEATLLGLPAVAVSQQATDGRFRLVDRAGYEWSPAARAAVELTRLILRDGLPPRSVLNINAPGRQVSGPVMVTRLGRRAWRRGGLVAEHTDEHGHGYYTFRVNDDADPPIEAEDGTDFAALAAGHISLTPMSLAWGDDKQRDRLTTWAHDAARELGDLMFGDLAASPQEREAS